MVCKVDGNLHLDWGMYSRIFKVTFLKNRAINEIHFCDLSPLTLYNLQHFEISPATGVGGGFLIQALKTRLWLTDSFEIWFYYVSVNSGMRTFYLPLGSGFCSSVLPRGLPRGS